MKCWMIKLRKDGRCVYYHLYSAAKSATKDVVVTLKICHSFIVELVSRKCEVYTITLF